MNDEIKELVRDYLTDVRECRAKELPVYWSEPRPEVAELDATLTALHQQAYAILDAYDQPGDILASMAPLIVACQGMIMTQFDDTDTQTGLLSELMEFRDAVIAKLMEPMT